MRVLIIFGTAPYEFLEPIGGHLGRVNEHGQKLSHEEFWFSVGVSQGSDSGLEIASDANPE